MASGSQVQVKVIFTKSGGAGGSVRVATGGRASIGTLAAAIALLNLGLAAGAYYAVWWPARSTLTGTAVLEAPLFSEADAAAFNRLFALKPARTDGEPPAVAPEPTEAASPGEGPSGFSSFAAQRVIPATLGGWIGLNSLACAVLACAAGAIPGGVIHRRGRARWLAGVAVVMLVGATAAGFFSWRFQIGAFDSALVAGTGVAILAFALLGLAFGGGGRAANRVAGLVVILSAAGSAAALALAARCGIGGEKILHPAFLSIAGTTSLPVLMAMVFVLQSLWGWILLVASGRLPRR